MHIPADLGGTPTFIHDAPVVAQQPADEVAAVNGPGAGAFDHTTTVVVADEPADMRSGAGHIGIRHDKIPDLGPGGELTEEAEIAFPGDGEVTNCMAVAVERAREGRALKLVLFGGIVRRDHGPGEHTPAGKARVHIDVVHQYEVLVPVRGRVGQMDEVLGCRDAVGGLGSALAAAVSGTGRQAHQTDRQKQRNDPQDSKITCRSPCLNSSPPSGSGTRPAAATAQIRHDARSTAATQCTRVRARRSCHRF